MQTAEAVRPQRQSSAARENRGASFTLPPSPTRSRKIIQMSPRQQAERDVGSSKKTPETTAGRAAPTSGKAAASAMSIDKGKKKQPSSASVAGRKIAGKMAHSLIERRRRTKMNKEFAVLKGMIPACTGEMHKLAILQASIDHVRYLEDCVAKLKAKQVEDQDRRESTYDPLPPIRDFHPTLREDPAVGGAELTDSDMASPELTGNHDSHRQNSISPALLAQDHRRHSHFLTSTELGQYSYSSSAGTSPAFRPQHPLYHVPGTASASESTLVSPILLQSDFDHEASAALLMLNKDRRDARARGRGLSVRDLLST